MAALSSAHLAVGAAVGAAAVAAATGHEHPHLVCSLGSQRRKLCTRRVTHLPDEILGIGVRAVDSGLG